MNTHYLKLRGILFLLFSIASSAGHAQNNTKDQEAIEAQIDAFFNSWNRHDFTDMKTYIAKDADFVNIVGMHWKGREDIQFAHQTYHETSFKDIPLQKRDVTVRFVNSNIAIAHVTMHRSKSIITPDGSIAPPGSALATFVFVKSKAVWLVEAVENVIVDEKAIPFNPVSIRNGK
jgi:uncharacterized protein (TIGR02246 family)